MIAPSPDAAPPVPTNSAGGRAERGAAVAPHTDSADAAGARRTPAQVAKDIGLFFAAPYVTLAYLAMFPVLGMKLLAQARRERKAAS